VSPRVVFGAGSIARLAEELDTAGLGRALVITTPGRAIDVERVLRVLGDCAAGVFDAAAPHVPVSVVESAAEVVRSAAPDVLVAVGGGSSIGLAKAIALRGLVSIAAVPTTYAGSEMTSIWGLTEAGVKRTGRDPRVAPVIVFYDPEFTLSLPAAVSAASGMNAMAHAVEALYAADATDEVRGWAEDAARGLAAGLPEVVLQPGDIDARDRVMRAAHLAGAALGQASMGLHHRLCHVLGGTFNLPHALTHAVLLPHVTAFNAPAAPDAMRRLARALGADEAPAALAALNRRLGIRVGLGALGLDRADIPRAAELATEGGYQNPRAATREDVLSVVQAAW
jgi:maleylacetate reductase